MATKKTLPTTEQVLGEIGAMAVKLAPAKRAASLMNAAHHFEDADREQLLIEAKAAIDSIEETEDTYEQKVQMLSQLAPQIRQLERARAERKAQEARNAS